MGENAQECVATAQIERLTEAHHLVELVVAQPKREPFL
jgi:hypothetical protein